MSDSVQRHRRQPTRLPHPWVSPGKNTGVGCHFLLQCMKVKTESEVTQSCPTLCDRMNCSLPGSSVHGIVQARILEWAAIAFSIGSITMNKSSEDDGIPAELFQILKDDAVKSATLNTSANLEDSAVATGLEKANFHPNSKEGQW